MIPRAGLVAEYLFNGTALDTSGRDAHGVIHGAAFAPDRLGRPHAALRLDGRDDFVEVSPPPSLSGPARTISVWAAFEPRNFEGWTNCLIAQDDGDDADQARRIFQLSAYDGRVVWHMMTHARDPMCKRRIRPGIWCHYAVVSDVAVHRLYLDGVLHDTMRQPLRSHATQALHIGRKGTPEQSFSFNGAIDDVRIYDRALGDHELVELFREGGFVKPAPRPVRPDEDPVSGKWGLRGVVLLDLRCDSAGMVTGQVMGGRPGNMAPIATGVFDRAASRLNLAGVAKDPDTGAPVSYRIEGMLDGRELAVSADFDAGHANLALTKRGARRRWWRDSRLRERLRQYAFAVARALSARSPAD